MLPFFWFAFACSVCWRRGKASFHYWCFSLCSNTDFAFFFHYFALVWFYLYVSFMCWVYCWLIFIGLTTNEWQRGLVQSMCIHNGGIYINFTVNNCNPLLWLPLCGVGAHLPLRQWPWQQQHNSFCLLAWHNFSVLFHWNIHCTAMTMAIS